MLLLRKIQAVLVGMVVIGCCSCLAHGESIRPPDRGDLSKFAATYLGVISKAMEKQQDFMSTGVTTQRVKRIEPVTNNTVIVRDQETNVSLVKSGTDKKLSMMRKEKDTYFDRILVSNEKRTFTVRRNAPDAKYFLEQREMPESYKKNLENTATILDEYCYLIGNSSEFKLANLLAGPFEVLKIENLDNADKLFKIVFVVPTTKPSSIFAKMFGSFVIDCSRDWAVSEYSFQAPLKSRPDVVCQISGRVEYSPTGHSLRDLVAVETRIASKLLDEYYSYMPSTTSTSPVNRNTFELSFYGLNEAGGAVKHSYLWIYLGLGATALLVLSVYLRYRSGEPGNKSAANALGTGSSGKDG